MFTFERAEALVFPLKDEDFGILLQLALKCGCQVIPSRIPTSVEVAGDIPFYFELDDSQSLFSAMDKAITEGRLPARVNRGLERARQYSWDSSARNTLDVYRELWDTMQVK